VTASFPFTLSDHPRLETLARAYGLQHRIRVREDAASSLEGSLDALVIDEGQIQTPGELLDRLQGTGPAFAVVPDDGVLRDHCIAVITNIPIHYRVGLFDRLASRLAADGAELHVFFLSDVPPDRHWIQTPAIGFSHEFLESFDVGRDGGRRLVPRSLHQALDRLAPTIVLSAGFSPLVSQRVARWCSGRSVFGLWSGEISSRPTAKNAIRAIQRRCVVGRADFAIAYGSASAAYLRSLRADLPVVIGRNSTICPEPTSRRGPNRCVELLAVSRAEQGKALELIVEAVLSLRDLDCRLTVIGAGKAIPALRARAHGSWRIRFLGALPPTRVLEQYAKADVFLFPSQYDVFGLVLVEAMAAGLAVVSSDKPGAVADLAAPGSNCILVSERSADAWARAIRRVVEDGALRERLGAAAQRTIASRWTLEHAADAMVAGFRLGALSAPTARAA
jgi:glycosyltransferase involved in cell wall biosynthesis